MSELIAIAYDDMFKAEEVRLALAKLQKEHLIELGDAAVVVILLAVATVIWTPIGVAIGFQPRLARLLQPVVQFLASFPANFVFPFATLFFIRTGISLDWGSILLMALGSQWYILFNSIAGAQSIPTDLREMCADVGLTGWQKWRKLIIPGIFSAWVTGGGDGERRGVECQYCVRGGELGGSHPEGNGVGGVYYGGDGTGGLGTDYPGNWHDEFVCGGAESGVLAQALHPS